MKTKAEVEVDLKAARRAAYKAQQAYLLACEVYKTTDIITDKTAYEVYRAARAAIDTTAQKLVQLRSGSYVG